jgi:membrane-associated phospholipid phosphatase
MRTTDRHWYLDVNTFSRHTDWLHGFMKAYALWGGLVLLALMAILAYFWARRRERLDGVVIAVLAGVGALISLGVNHFVSQAVARTRPCHVATLHVHSLLACANDYSFPSDHAVIAGALAMGLLLFAVRWGILATLLALLLAFSRVYVGVHYPGDVVAGLLMGALITIILFLLLRRPGLTVTNRLAQTPMRPLVAAGPRSRVGATY